MTERVHSITLVLDRDIRDDDAEFLVIACRQLRGVIDVRPNVVDVAAMTADTRARHRLRKVLYGLIPEAVEKLEREE